MSGTADVAPFQAHIELLQFFLARRDAIVEHIQGMLNAQRKPVAYRQNHPLLSRHLDDGFFALPGITASQSRLRGQLQESHWAGGFRPRDLPGLHNALIDPAEMMIRGFHMWQQTHWPGRSGRIRYAHTLFNLYLLRSLALLTMRLWDGTDASAGDRLSQVQAVLDQLWQTAPPDQPMLVRDARWLIPLAQSPATDELGAYFDIAEKIAGTLSDEDRIAVHNANVRMAGGHLRSQLHYYSRKKTVPLDEHSLVLNTRTTNALDYALLIQDLVPLLESYDRARHSGGDETRLHLASAICQGISPDPELFVNRVELLGAYSMIEHLFITVDGHGHAAYTRAGRRHVELLQEYRLRMARLSKSLSDDCARVRPVAGAYSPFGAIYGFSSDLIEHMALKASQPDAVTHVGLEDVFVDGDARTLAWVTGWRTLPHVTPEVQKLFDYPQTFADAIFGRVARALARRVSDDERNTTAPTGRLVVLAGNEPPPNPDATAAPELPIRYIRSSDPQVVAAHAAEAQDESSLQGDRREGRCLLSYRTTGGWVAISKAVLTEVLGAGLDARVAGLPRAAAGVLTLMCPDLVVLPEDPASELPPRE